MQMKIKLKNKKINIDGNPINLIDGITQFKNADIELDLTSEEIEEITKKEEVKLRPNDGSLYSILTKEGYIAHRTYDTISDEGIWDAGNGFYNDRQALEEIERRQAIVRIKDYIKKEGLNLGTRIVFVDKDDNTMDETVFDKFQEDNKEDLGVLEKAL